MKNFIIIALIVFVAWVFLGRKAENLKDQALGNNENLNGNPQVGGGENVGTAIIHEVGGAVNLLIDRAFTYAQHNNPPDTGTSTL